MRSYRQYCGVAKALDVLGERWTLLIVRDLLLGTRRFSDLSCSLVGITPNLLSKRLRHLKEHGLIETTAADSPTRGYSLTEAGRALEGIILGLGAFGSSYMSQPAPDDRLDPRSAMLSLKRRYRGAKSSGLVAVEIGPDQFAVRFGGQRIEVRDGAPHKPDVRLSGTFEGWFPLLSRRSTLRELEGAGKLSRLGSVRHARAFVRAIGARV